MNVGPKARTALSSLGLVACIFALYGQVAGHDFVAYDSGVYITNNPRVLSGLSWNNVVWAFTIVWASNWHPLTWISHMLDVQLFGLKPAGHQLENVAWHAANTVILFLFLQRTTRQWGKSLFVAALFALHPLRVESVAWIVERKDLLCAFFGLLSLYFYALYAERPSLVRYLAAFTCLACGLMSKPMIVTWPFVMLLLDVWPLERTGLGQRRLLLEKLPFLALSLAMCAATVMAQSSGGAVQSLSQLPLDVRFEDALGSYAAYIEKLFWPTNLALHYPLGTGGPPWHMIALGGALVVGGSIFALLEIRRRKYFVGWFFFLGALVPVIGIVQVGAQAFADRFTYLPAIGVFVIVAWAGEEICARIAGARASIALDPRDGERATTDGSRKTASAESKRSNDAPNRTSDAASRTSDAASRTSDAASRTSDAPKHTGDVPKHTSAGPRLSIDSKDSARSDSKHNEMTDANRNTRYVAKHIAKSELVSAREAPANTRALNRGRRLALSASIVVCIALTLVSWRQIGTWKDTETVSEHALAVTAENNVAHNLLGMALADQNRLDEAAAHLHEALRIAPGDVDSIDNYGAVLTRLNRLDEAEALFRKGLSLAPTRANLHHHLGITLQSKGRYDEALLYLNEAVRLFPEYAAAHGSRGQVLEQLGRNDEARTAYERSIAIRPNYIPALMSLARLLVRLNDNDGASVVLTRAVAIDPNNAEIHRGLARAYMARSRAREALAELDLVLRLRPDWPLAEADLARLLATTTDLDVRNVKKAIELGERAARASSERAPTVLDSLAEAYAADQRYPDACVAAEKALARAKEMGDVELAGKIERRLKAYRENKVDKETPR